MFDCENIIAYLLLGFGTIASVVLCIVNVTMHRNSRYYEAIKLAVSRGWKFECGPHSEEYRGYYALFFDRYTLIEDWDYAGHGETLEVAIDMARKLEDGSMSYDDVPRPHTFLKGAGN